MALTQIDLTITLTTAERNAWQLIKPKLKTYMTKIFRAYQKAPPSKRAELRAHNPILDAVLDTLGY